MLEKFINNESEKKLTSLSDLSSIEIEERRKQLKQLSFPYSNREVVLSFTEGSELRDKFLTELGYRVLTRKEVIREQPPAKQEIKEIIFESFKKTTPVELATIWGGYKNTESGQADDADELALDLVKSTIDKLNEIAIDIKVSLYFADIHAISPYFGRNLEIAQKSKNYFQGITKMAEERGFDTTPISRSLYGFLFEDLEKALSGTEGRELFYTHDQEKEREIFKLGENFWQKADDKIKAEITQAAEKYSVSEVKTEKDLKKLAILYAGSRIFEKGWLDEIHKNGIFFAYGRPIYELQPRKTIFWHSIKGGINQPPWFMDAKKDLNKQNE